MKRIFITLALFIGVAQFSILDSQFSIGGVAAQDFTYEFSDEQGTIIPNGSVVKITKAEEADDGSGDVVMNSGIYVKNIDGDASDLLRISYEVQTMDNGSMQICFPSACKFINSVSAGSTNPGTLRAGLSSIATEWFPLDYGKCTVKISLETVVKTIGDNYTVIDDGPSLTLNFVYADPAHVDDAGASVAVPVAYYSLSGQRLSSSHRGIAVVRLSDGSVEKRILR